MTLLVNMKIKCVECGVELSGDGLDTFGAIQEPLCAAHWLEYGTADLEHHRITDIPPFSQVSDELQEVESQIAFWESEVQDWQSQIDEAYDEISTLQTLKSQLITMLEQIVDKVE